MGIIRLENGGVISVARLTIAFSGQRCFLLLHYPSIERWLKMNILDRETISGWSESGDK